MILAVVVGRFVLLRRARTLGICREEIAPLYLCALPAGLAGALLPPLVDPRSGITSFGGALAALAAVILFCGLRGYSLVRSLGMLDVLAFAGAFAAALGRLGCAVAHDHRGLPSTSWLAVRFPEGPRYDLGLIDFLFLAAMCGAFRWLGRRPRPVGFFLFSGMIAYSAFRLLRALLETEPHVTGWGVVCAAGMLAVLLKNTRYPAIVRL